MARIYSKLLIYRRVVTAVLAVLYLTCLCSQLAAEQATVLSVSDGDTVVVRIGRERERIRLIGIDTPESHPNRRAKKIAARDHQELASILDQGKAASQFTQKLLPSGTAVRVEYDIEKRDHYGRLLGYLWLSSGEMINETIIASGYAYPLTIPPNVRYRERFLKGFQAARHSKRGLWAR